MKKIYKSATLALVATCIFLPLQANAGAWVLPKGQGHVIAEFSYYSVDTFYDVNGDDLHRERFHKVEFAPLTEYGLTDSLTIGITPRVQHANQDYTIIAEKSTEDIADTDIFIRQALWQNANSVFSIQPLVKIPGPYNENDSPTLGAGQIDAEIRALFGQTFRYFDEYHFYNLEAAYRHRFEAPEDEWHFDATLGIGLEERWKALFQSFNTYSMDIPSTNSLVPASWYDYDLNKVQASVVNDLTNSTSVQVGVFGHVYGKNTGGDGGVVFSVWQKF